MAVPSTESCRYRPPITILLVLVASVTTGSAPGCIHEVTVIAHVPSNSASLAWCSPGVIAFS